MRWLKRSSVVGSLILALVACDGGSPEEPAPDAGMETPRCARPVSFEKSPGPSLEGSGWHRVYLQGSSAPRRSDGRFETSEHRNEIQVGDQFLLSSGTFVEWIVPLSGALTGHIFLHLAHVEDPGARARYEVELLRSGATRTLVNATDSSSGEMGYAPFEGCFFSAEARGSPGGGDALVVRATNTSTVSLGVVVRSPDYFSWLELELL